MLYSMRILDQVFFVVVVPVNSHPCVPPKTKQNPYPPKTPKTLHCTEGSSLSSKPFPGHQAEADGHLCPYA
jgi:hypothetical protein